MRKKQWKDLERRTLKERDESDTGDKNKVEGVKSVWSSSKKLEQDCDFRSEHLQEENNKREAREIQHNQLQAQQMQA